MLQKHSHFVDDFKGFSELFKVYDSYSAATMQMGYLGVIRSLGQDNLVSAAIQTWEKTDVHISQLYKGSYYWELFLDPGPK